MIPWQGLVPGVRLQVNPEVGKDQLGSAEMEVRGLQGSLHAQDRQLRQAPRRVPGLASLQGEAGGHAGRRQDLQEANAGVLARLDAAARDGRGVPGGIRGRHPPVHEGLRAHRQERGARAGVVRCVKRELRRLWRAHGPHRAS